MREQRNVRVNGRPLPFFLKRTREGVVLAVYSCPCCGRSYQVRDPAGRHIPNYCIECDLAYLRFKKTMLDRIDSTF